MCIRDRHELISKRLLKNKSRKKLILTKQQGNLSSLALISKKYEDMLRKERITSEMLLSAKNRNTTEVCSKLMRQALLFSNAKLRLLKTIDPGIDSYSIFGVKIQ
eukprot:TRINITY_DN14225_c0_g1_i9.p2 TRINITY_DN14225_c0_g1~~TRINITY_DN14225_c0_g1_i9.p2  ORF type:complete len:105 (-),score=16.83 TRINITY_DN14225_c0_g1_i9:428-742(-)